ncbi:MAG TPA: methyltransferase domain-containing protein [Ignavibacteria bacterium]|nr:methyltransferase domain-containing protein [Ignavibacteria bacterium]
MNYRKYTTYKDIEDIKRLEYIVASITAGTPAGGRILDIGCGNGNISIALGSLGYNVTGIDMDAATIENAKKNNKFKNVEFKVLNANDITPGTKFDAVVCSEVLEHLSNPELLVEQIGKLLKKDGIFLATVPNGYGPREVLITKPVQFLNKKGFYKVITGAKKLMGFRNMTLQSSSGDLTHIQFFTRKRLSRIISHRGFREISFKHGNFVERVLPFSILTRRIKSLQKVDCNIADKLPSFAVSAFYSAWQKA